MQIMHLWHWMCENLDQQNVWQIPNPKHVYMCSCVSLIEVDIGDVIRGKGHWWLGRMHGTFLHQQGVSESPPSSSVTLVHFPICHNFLGHFCKHSSVQCPLKTVFMCGEIFWLSYVKGETHLKETCEKGKICLSDVSKPLWLWVN